MVHYRLVREGVTTLRAPADPIVVMISAVLFVNTKGDVIISRYFRDDVTKLDADAFRLRVIAAKEASVPIIRIDDCSSMYIRHGDLHVVTMSKSNCHPALCFEYMFKLVEVRNATYPNCHSGP